MICHSCLTNIKSFTAHKASYTPEFIAAVQSAASNANKIPNKEQRQSKSTELRTVVAEAGDTCCTNLLTLFSYIEGKGLPGGKWASMKKMAGGAYYDEARSSNWGSLTTMNIISAAIKASEAHSPAEAQK